MAIQANTSESLANETELPLKPRSVGVGSSMARVGPVGGPEPTSSGTSCEKGFAQHNEQLLAALDETFFEDLARPPKGKNTIRHVEPFAPRPFHPPSYG